MYSDETLWHRLMGKIVDVLAPCAASRRSAMPVICSSIPDSKSDSSGAGLTGLRCARACVLGYRRSKRATHRCRIEYDIGATRALRVMFCASKGDFQCF